MTTFIRLFLLLALSYLLVGCASTSSGERGVALPKCYVSGRLGKQLSIPVRCQVGGGTVPLFTGSVRAQ